MRPEFHLFAEKIQNKRFPLNRANWIRIHGISYRTNSVVRIIPPTNWNTTETFLYCQIKCVFVKDHKVFLTTVFHVVTYEEHLRAYEVCPTSHQMLATYAHFRRHGVLHLKNKGGKTFVIEKDVCIAILLYVQRSGMINTTGHIKHILTY